MRILDERTLLIPDRPGNRIADSLRNILLNPHVGLLFMIPGKQETLRVSGGAVIVRDRWLRDKMTVAGKTPEFAIVVKVREVFFHCAKCVIRSGLWDAGAWPTWGCATCSTASPTSWPPPKGCWPTTAPVHLSFT